MKKTPSTVDLDTRNNVEILVEDKTQAQPPSTFRLCPLGVQFYSEKRLREFSLYEFNLAVPGKSGRKKKVKCTGAVVRCQKDTKNEKFRVWIQFIDLPKTTREKIHCTARDGKTLCCYCQNFQ